MKIRDANGHINNSFCYEKVMDSLYLKEFLEAPSVSTEGEWQGFYVDKNRNYWGLKKSIMKKLRLSKKTIYKIINSEKINFIKVHDKMRKLQDAYSLEEIKKFIKLK